ncbi:MAG: 4-hydroxy-2-oxovalerate aldolase [Candidatus Magasanikbacteria bacterium]|nr:4-hydroxy-2-oxovalerate aldolase [Candidatus Magasanikbacteria bacterium]
MKDIMIFDSTLRDGQHAISHQLTANQVQEYCREIDNAGEYVVIVGHGNGLGASSMQVGLSATSDTSLLESARQELKKTRLGVFLLPGFGTIKNDLAPAIQIGVDLVCVASHCTEADVTKQYISYVAEQNKEVYGILMMYHMTTKERLLEEAKKMISYGARGIIIMDSAGASTPALVKETISYLVQNVSVPVGFHAHNNLGMAVAHTWMALEAGARIVDGTLRGFGAGAGNCQIEVLMALLKKMDYAIPVDLRILMEVSDRVVTSFMKKAQEIDSVSIASGLAGVFSGFSLPVKRAAAKFQVNPIDIFIELGKRKVVGGQEDMVVEVALELAKLKNNNI